MEKENSNESTPVLVSKTYSNLMYINDFNGSINTDLRIGKGEGRTVEGRFTACDPRHEGVMVKKVDGVEVGSLHLGVDNERTIGELARNITQHTDFNVVARHIGNGRITLIENALVPSLESKVDIVYEMGPPEDLPELDTPCFGIGTLEMKVSQDPVPGKDASTYKLVVNGVEFDSEDIKTLKEIIDERKSQNH